MTEKRAAHGPHLAGRTTKNGRSGRTRRQRKRGRPVRTRQDGETAGRRAPEQARILRDGAPRRTGLGKRGAAREPHRGGVTAGGRAAEAGTAREREGRPEPRPEPETEEPHGDGTGRAACPGAVDGDGAAGRRGPKRKKGPDALSGPLRRRLPALPLPQYHRRDGA